MENNNTQRVGTTARNNRTMNRKGPFIRFDIAMLNSLDMTLVRQKYGIEGWGIVLYIMKCLLERHTDCRAPLSIVPEIAHLCHKSKRTILQLIRDFPALFEIEPDGQTFTSPYLLQLFVKCSAKNEKSNSSLNKLTNETIDNQPVNVPKNNEQEQEQKKTTKRVEKVDDADDAGKLMERDTETKPSNTSPNPSGTSPNPSDTSPNPSEGGERKLLANLIFLPRYCYKRTLEYGCKNGLHAQYSSKYRHEGTLEYRHASGLHAQNPSIFRHKRAFDYGRKSGLHARHPSLYSPRGQTLYSIRQARKLGLPPFGRVGVGIGRDSGWVSWRVKGECPDSQYQPFCDVIPAILCGNIAEIAR